MQVAGIFGSAILEVAIGLLFLYFVLSTICSAVIEIVAAILKWRASTLEFALANMLTDKDLLIKVADHPLIRSLGQRSSDARGRARTAPAGKKPVQLEGRPSYIGAKNFSLALLHTLANPLPPSKEQSWRVDMSQVLESARILANTEKDVAKQQTGQAVLALMEQARDPKATAEALDALKKALDDNVAQAPPETDPQLLQHKLKAAVDLTQIKTIVASVEDSDFKALADKTITGFESQIDAAGLELDKVRLSIEGWFDRCMERASGVYKRKTIVAVAIVAAIVTVFSGADSINFVSRLYVDAALRTQLAAAGTDAAGKPVAATNLGDAVKQLEPFSTLFGYADVPGTADPKYTGSVVLKITGEVITVFALMQGSNFWFQLLTKLVNLRSTGPPPPTDAKKTEAA
jgi:hypothetical protein